MDFAIAFNIGKMWNRGQKVKKTERNQGKHVASLVGMVDVFKKQLQTQNLSTTKPPFRHITKKRDCSLFEQSHESSLAMPVPVEMSTCVRAVKKVYLVTFLL
jgi:hypothetical protein